MSVINTLKFKSGLYKGRFPNKCHDWLGIHFYACNVIRFSFTLLGYGFWAELTIYNVMKGEDNE